MKGELSYALSIAHIEILYCSTMKHILETILAFLTGLYCCHCAGAVTLFGHEKVLSVTTYDTAVSDHTRESSLTADSEAVSEAHEVP